MARAIIYCRQSQTDLSRESLSLASQETELRRWAERERHQVVRVLIDPDEKGADASRPGLLELQSLADRRMGDIVAVWKLDRLARNLRLQEIVVDRIAAAGLTLYSLREPMVSDPLYRQILGAINEARTRDQSEHTRRVLSERRSRGWHLGGRVAYGYAQPDRYGPPVPDLDHPERIAAVRLMFELRSQGISTVDIAARLTATGLAAPYGGPWHSGTVRELLRNPVYIGRYNYGVESVTAAVRYSDARVSSLRVTHEAIVDEALWRAVQTVNPSHNRHRSPRVKSQRSWLEGLITHECGHAMYGAIRKNRDGTPRLGFTCGSTVGQRRTTPIRCLIRPASIGAETAEAGAWRAISLAVLTLLPEAEVLAAAERHWQASEPEAILSRERLTREIAALELERGRVERLYRTGRRNDEWFDREDALIADRLAAARSELDALPAAPDPGEISATWRSIATLRDALAQITQPDDRRRVLAELGTIRIPAIGDPILIPSPAIAPYLPSSGPPPSPPDWPQLLRDIRAERGWTREQLAADIGTSRASVAKWEQAVYPPHRRHHPAILALAPPRHATDG